MNSVIVRTISRGMLPALLMYSLFLLNAGHDAPGGGFVGGLVAASAFVLYSLAYDVPAARHVLRVDSKTLVGAGLALALATALLPVAGGQAFMTGLWTEVALPGVGTITIGTPIVFDIGVYLLVLGVTLTILLPLREQ